LLVLVLADQPSCTPQKRSWSAIQELQLLTNSLGEVGRFGQPLDLGRSWLEPDGVALS
jgi:hypothetical protein